MSFAHIGFAISLSALGFLPFACGGKVIEIAPGADAAIDGTPSGTSTSPTTTATPTATPTTTPTTPPPSPSCPDTPPAAGTPCVPSVACGYPCMSGVQVQANCATGVWSISKTACTEPMPGGVVGKPCAHSAECDLTGAGTDFCGADSFSLGPLSPTPTCVQVDCAVPTTDAPAFCGGGGENAICLSGSPGSTGICIGACRFDGSGAAPSGCPGKDACNPYSWRVGPSGAMEGFGYCIGGCRVDGDCPAGSQCQTDARLCVKTVNPTPKKQDEPCKNTESTPSLLICNCVADLASGAGYCARACSVGESCGAGHVCDPMLPTSFSTLPKGVAGACLKTCTKDGDCLAGTVCRQSGGIAGKTCQPLTRH
jgi:hypothetical protein